MFTLGVLMRTIGLISALLAIVGLVLVEFLFRDRLQRSTYHWLLLLGLCVFPGLTLLGTATTFLEETTTVRSCASCHVMTPFINDMRNPESVLLAARHYKNRWIPDRQCYTCHTNYGVHGALVTKLDAARRWLRYVTGSWQEPIRYKGTYPNGNCLSCHAEAQKFQRVSSHTSLMADLISSRVGCISCHGLPHPAPSERLSRKGR
jgi:cytochrome c nitrite reductase small subunit